MLIPTPQDRVTTGRIIARYDPVSTRPGSIEAGQCDDMPSVQDVAAHRNAALEEAAALIERRAAQRFDDHGIREWDTNATYYKGSVGEIYESLDEEDEDIAAAIRALKAPEMKP